MKPKLEWEQNQPSNPMSWDEATQYADSLNTMSEYGWRLPTRGELDEAYRTKVKGFQSYNYWSSTISDLDTLNAWYVDFSDGVGHYYYKKGRVFVRCVREVK
jgi:formylglycine-generating enzyme required for sulfatase activity